MCEKKRKIPPVFSMFTRGDKEILVSIPANSVVEVLKAGALSELINAGLLVEYTRKESDGAAAEVVFIRQGLNSDAVKFLQERGLFHDA